jgi:predicted transcriptional regulator
MISDGFVRLFSPDSVMTGKLVKRGLIVLQDYSVPVLMRARIDQVMRKQFSVVRGEVELRNILKEFSPENVQLLPVVDNDGALLGVVEPHDLLRADTADHHFTMRELARQDFVRAYPGDLVDRVNRDMLLKNVDNVVVIESRVSPKPIGIVRANDILQLRRWLVEEESVEHGGPGAKPS